MSRLSLRQTFHVVMCGAWLAAGCQVETEGLGDWLDGRSPPDAVGPGLPDGSVPMQPADAEAAADADLSTSDGAAQEACAAEGSFALRIDASVRWMGTTLFGIVPIIQPGTGAFSINTYVDVTRAAGGGLTATLRVCGASVPDFSASVGERYGVFIPETVWEKLDTRWSAAVTQACSDPGCMYTSSRLIAQMGISIPDTAPWPSARDTLNPNTLLDADGDGIPGLLLVARGELDPPGYKYPPTSYLLTQRIREMMLAIRVAASLDGKVDSCDARSGSASGLTIDTRALACRVLSGDRCNEDQLSFLDDNLPVWAVDSATWRMVRLPANPSCADARAALP